MLPVRDPARKVQATRCHADLPAPDGRSAPGGGTPSQSGQSGSGEKNAYALPFGGFKPHYVPLMAGFVRIVATMVAPGRYTRRFHAPFEDYLGRTNAVVLSMLVAGIAMWAVGALIVRNKWHETRAGLVGIVVVGLGLIFGLQLV